jgi:hypothetical protein
MECNQRWCATIIQQCLELYSVMIMLQACTCAEISVFHHQQGYMVTLRSVMRKAYRSGYRDFTAVTDDGVEKIIKKSS